ncbi:hypothetical protein QBC33DRAFT_229452 [Phialemonium atrogriseum]|uniref:Uncharacterized protein n=1 Tax=Phialemonium atrogriseum TaxID=1093897 RepID=A0AAJ0FQB9_9PEZI|nr:uncharacterized protein QBC33DRAFT_229452 [Phialemonium atrogriseum]KAK1771074.1 hypothetical protein QBC33DRAFT_229452 [Phialemonium atrogriseum]
MGGVDSKKKSAVPPLPAPTETESTSVTPTELATDVSKSVATKSSYSLPEDGTPVTIKTRGHKSNHSQTSLLIEYFEGGKPSSSSKSGDQRKPSVRVRLTPSRKSRGKSTSERDHIQITESKPRKASLSRRSTTPVGAIHHSEGEALSALSGDFEDMSSYASATEESNVSRNPIDIEIDRGGHVRRRRPASPLIPAAGSSAASYQPPAMSDISAIPTDSFLDGSGHTTSYRMSEAKHSRSRSPSRTGDVLAGAAAGLAAATVADKLRTKSRDREKDRITVSKSRDKDKSERKSKSGKSRSSSGGERDRHTDRSKTPRKRSSGGHQESLVSVADSSVMSSNLSPSHRSADQHSVRSLASKTSSINNPKLLETVEDVIRRLILPELNALKREQSKHKSRRDSATSSTTSISRDEHASDRRRSSATDRAVETPREALKKERRDREARNDFDYSPPQNELSRDLGDDSVLDIEQTPKRSGDRLRAAAAGGVLGAVGAAAAAAAMGGKSPSEDKRTRRRRRAELRNRSSDHVAEDYGDSDVAPAPPMPLMSEINPSDVTRTSILSADTDRPRSASEELTPVQEVQRGGPSAGSDSTTPTRTLQGSLGTQHANISHGDLKELPRRRTGDFGDDALDATNYGRKNPAYTDRQFDEEDYEDDGGHDMAYTGGPGVYDYYNTQDVPPPLKYEPYQPERRGLSPIPSVSGYTEGGSEAPNRDSRVTHTSGSVSSAENSPRHDATMHSPNSIPSNIMGREFGDDDGSLRSPGLEYRNPAYTEDSELDRPSSGQAVRAIAANPQFVDPPITLESNVASLVDGSMLDDSVVTGESGRGGNQAFSPRESMETLEEERSHHRGSPAKRSVESHGRAVEGREGTPGSDSLRSREFMDEYEVDDYGNKVPRSKYRQSPTASEAAITVPAAIAAAAALKAAQSRGKQTSTEEEAAEEFTPAGVQRNRSFKERAMNGAGPLNSPTHSADRMMDDYEQQPKMGFHAIPNANDPMPEIGNWHEEDTESVTDGHQRPADEEWHGDATPRQLTPMQYEYHDGHNAHDIHEKGSGHGRGLLIGGAAAAAAAAAAAMASSANHSRQPSQEQVEEWHRTSDDRKRDTLVTNPYEGTSPIVNLPDLNDNILGGGQGYGNGEFSNGYTTHSPLGHKVDEGYISQGPNKTPDVQSGKVKGVDFDPRTSLANQEDPFYTPKHTRHLSGMSQGMASPFYDGATGTGIDRIESKDIIALMQHLTVRDAQRSARDTEILVTLVRSAAEMRNSFEDIKRLLADTEDVIITEVKDNTEKTVQRAIGGPRPFPGSGARSLQGGSQAGTMNYDDLPAKRRSLFRRALKGLSAKGTNDLGRIEEMLMQLLTEVDVLKSQTAQGVISASHQDGQSLENLQSQIPYEQDRGYEPEGHAGTSTASHASQSGHLSIPQSRGASAKLGYDRKYSDHRISTVPEANEDDYDHEPAHDHTYQSNPDMLMTPACEPQRGSSVPLGTPPQPTTATQASVSNDNTPRSEKGKKQKSSSSSSWFPKISRWSETTTSSVAQAFRRSGQSRKNDDDGNRQGATSRSGSDLIPYDDGYPGTDPYGDDKLHTGFSEADLIHGDLDRQGGSPGNNRETAARQHMQHQPPPPAMNFVSMTPEVPKYKAHRNSLNLQHPQPRPGQSDLFKATLESQAHEFDSPRSPRSAEWAGSATSLHRLPRNANRDSYGSATDQAGQQRYWTSSPSAGNVMTTAGPPRPPKEPLDRTSSPGAVARGTPPKSNRISKLQKQSPLPYHSVESGYGTMTHGAPSASYVSHAHTHSGDGSSPRPENRNLSSALGVPMRRPSGPRAMTPKSVGSEEGDADRRRKRDTFGTITSQDTDTF